MHFKKKALQNFEKRTKIKALKKKRVIVADFAYSYPLY